MKRVFCLGMLALLFSALVFSLLCLRFTRGDTFTATSAYCRGHGAFSVSITLPRDLPRVEDFLKKLEETLPPLLSYPPILLWEMLSTLWQTAERIINVELYGCTAFP